LKSAFSNSRVLLPVVHAGIALTLLSSLYLPGWRKWRVRDVVEQQRIEAEANTGKWPPTNTVGFEPCYFGPPRQISAMLPANLPAVLISGVLVVPGNAHDHLLEPAPGRLLPSTRILIFIPIFGAVVAFQWYFLARITSTPRVTPSWRKVIYIAPIACVPLGLVLREAWGDMFRIASLPFWLFMVTGTILQYRKKQPSQG
jgi:hypothetical protein